MNQMTPVESAEAIKASLARVAERLKSIALLHASGMDDDARELLAAASAELERTGRDMLSLAGGAAGKEAAMASARLDRLAAYAGADGPAESDVGMLLDVSELALDACWALWGRLRGGVLKSASHTRKRVAVAAAAGLLACVLAATAIWGPSVYGRYKDDLNKRRIREVEGVLTEMASLAFNAKKASEQTLVKITGETCSDCQCGKSKNLQELYETDTCLLRWRKAIGVIFKAATGKENVPSRFLADPWGAPFALNENEGEVPGECTPDILRSAGPDGVLNTGDDIGIQVPLAFCRQGGQ